MARVPRTLRATASAQALGFESTRRVCRASTRAASGRVIGRPRAACRASCRVAVLTIAGTARTLQVAGQRPRELAADRAQHGLADHRRRHLGDLLQHRREALEELEDLPEKLLALVLAFAFQEALALEEPFALAFAEEAAQKV